MGGNIPRWLASARHENPKTASAVRGLKRIKLGLHPHYKIWLLDINAVPPQ